MRKIIVLSILTSITISATAQKFGIFGGPQMTSSRYSMRGSKQPNTAKYGFQLGAGWKIPFDNQLYFSPSAYYSLKGYKVKFNRLVFPPDSNAVDNNTTIHTFELAFLLQYDLSKKPNTFFIRLGPSLDFQLSGKEKFNRKNDPPVDRNMKYDFGNYGRYGASMVAHFGYETSNGFSFFAQYTRGIGSINNADGGPRIVHRAYGVSVGKYLTKKKS
jgi:hypothetical protein